MILADAEDINDLNTLNPVAQELRAKYGLQVDRPELVGSERIQIYIGNGWLVSRYRHGEIWLWHFKCSRLISTTDLDNNLADVIVFEMAKHVLMGCSSINT